MQEAGPRLPPRQTLMRFPQIPAGAAPSMASAVSSVLDATAAAGGAEGGIDCASLPLTDGFVVYRALLCCAVCTQMEGCCPASESARPGSEAVRSGVHRPSQLKLVSSTEWKRLRDAALTDKSAPLLGHQTACMFVLAKTTVMQCPRKQLSNQLQYELIAFKQAARSQETAFSSSTLLSKSETTGIHAFPSLMTLPDDRTALVQRDILGCTVEEIISSGDLQIVSLTQSHRPTMPKDSAWIVSQSSTAIASFCSVTTLPLHELASRLRGIVACALSICASLERLHLAGIVHKSLHPSSIVLPPRCVQTALECDETQLSATPTGCTFIDLGHSSLLPREKARSNTTLDSLSFSQWLHSAPECSGRMRSIIDNRSDLYALGCVVYELVCGESPFARAGSAAEVIHHHLALPPASLVPTFMTPESHPARHSMLSCINAVIQKLLSKSAEDRYQCCAGLIFDLRHILSVLVREEGHERLLASPKPSALVKFKIGERDWSGTLRLSQRLYGRDHELSVLLEALQELRNKKQSPSSVHRRQLASTNGAASSSGACTLVLVSSRAGVGKTTLCDELQKRIIRQRGLLACARFSAEGDPSSVLLQAFRSLILQLLAVDSVVWRIRLLRALGSQNCFSGDTLVETGSGFAQAICDVAPRTQVLSFDAAQQGHVLKRTNALLDQGTRSCVELLFSDGRTVTCTPDHRFLDADGKTWIEAQRMQVGATELAAGVQHPTLQLAESDGDAGWSLSLGDELPALDMAGRREHALTFAGLLGYLLTAGSVSASDAVLSMGHSLDAQWVQRDLYLLTGCNGAASPGSQHGHVTLPAVLHRSMLHVGVRAEERLESKGGFPEFLLAANCPAAVVQAFLGGLFGGDGEAPSLSWKEGRVAGIAELRWSCSRKGAVQAEAGERLSAELQQLFARVGMPVNSIVLKSSRTSAAKECSPNKSYSLMWCIPLGSTLAFAERIGFRYSCHKQMRLTAAASWYRMLERQKGTPALGMSIDRALREWDALKFFSDERTQAKRDASSAKVVCGVPAGAQALPTFRVKLVGRRPLPAPVHVWDLTVPGTENFLAQGVGAHNCAVLAESLPELENLVGPLPPPPRLSVHDLAAHTRIAFVQLVAALSIPDSPFTLIVDNAHHASSEALQLLQQLFTRASGGAGALLLVLAFRVPLEDAHPLTEFIRQVRLIGSPKRKMMLSASAPSASSMQAARANGSRAGARIIELQLKPLGVQDIQQLLQDSFPRVDQPFPALAHILHTKTGGSPFFLLQLLQSLYSRRLLWFDFETGEWKWQLADIVSCDVPSDVVGMLTSHMSELSTRAQQVLQYAACIGRSFSLQMLATATEMPQGLLVESVCELEREGMLMCTAHANELAILNSVDTAAITGSSSSSSSTSSSSLPSVSGRLDEIILQFSHDHVRDAAYKLSPVDIPRLHLLICDRLLDAHTLSGLMPVAREIVSHLMAGQSDTVAHLHSSLFAAHPQRMQLLMELARAAGMQARKAGEFANARDFFTQALRLLEQIATTEQGAPSPAPASSSSSSFVPMCGPGPSSVSPPMQFDFITVSPSVWSRFYDEALSVYAELGLTLLLTGELTACEQIFEYVHLRAHDVLDMREFFVLNLASLRQQNRLVEAVCCSLKHIEELGLKLLEQPTPELLASLDPPAVPAGTKRGWDGDSLESHPISKLPRNTNPHSMVSMQLLVAMLPLLVRLASPLMSSVAATLNDLTVRHGRRAESAVGVGLHAVWLWQRDRLEDAHWTMQLALHLAKRWQDSAITAAQVQGMGVARIFPWVLSLRECQSIAMATADDLASEGDLHSAAYVITNAAMQAVLCGMNLDDAQVQHHLIKERHWNWSSHAPMLAHSYLWMRLVQRLQLTGPAGDNVSLEWRTGEWKTDLRLIEECELDHNFFTAWSGRVACGIAAFFEGDVHHALELLESSWFTRARMAGFPEQGALALYLVLALCATLPPRPAHHCPDGLSFEDHAATEVDHFSPDQSISAKPALSDQDRAHVNRTLERINELIRQMSVWAAAAPSTHLHRLQLMQAERCLLCYTHLGSRHLLLPGMRLMQEASDQALRNGFVLEYAVVLERHYLYHLACEREVPSRYWLAHSYHAYADARCFLKCKRMESAHPVLASPTRLITHVMSAGDPALNQQTLRSFRSVIRAGIEETSPSNSPSIAFDLFSVLKATSSLSTEKDECKLLRRTMTLMIETAGASRGVLILRPRESVSMEGASDEDAARSLGRTESLDGWCVELEANVNDTEPQSASLSFAAQAAEECGYTPSSSDPDSAHPSASHSPLDEEATTHIHIEAPRCARMEDVLPVSLLSYIVSARESVMLTELERESTSTFAAFSQDPYFATHHPKAIMCTPLMRGGRVYGGLYLENSLNPDAFTTSHVQLLQLLCSQAALSIDNARLYARLEASHATLERLVQFRTAELVDKNVALQTAMEMAEKASRVKSEFLSSMSHELRTPMNAVLGVSRLLAETPLCDEQRHYLSMIINSGHLLLTIINDILDYSKIEVRTSGHMRTQQATAG